MAPLAAAAATTASAAGVAAAAARGRVARCHLVPVQKPLPIALEGTVALEGVARGRVACAGACGHYEAYYEATVALTPEAHRP